MKKTFYIQLDENNYITDCIEFPYEGYIEAELSVPLPEAFTARCYKYLGDNLFEVDKEKFDKLRGGYSSEGIEEMREALNILLGGKDDDLD